MINLTVNGTARQLAPGSTLADLVRQLDLGERRIAIERNGHIVPRGEHASTLVSQGDQIEIVVAVGGG